MFYPLKFQPVYKDYLWGGRNLEKLGKKLPDGQVAESWEVSGHPDGLSIVANGEDRGLSLPEYLQKYGRQALGSALSAKYSLEFPLLVKLIDANNKLSVQVHPTDEYARTHEGGYGKNEMWYIIAAKPGAQLIYGLEPGVDKAKFAQAISSGTIGACLHSVEVSPGDVFDIPAGLVHGIGEGIILAEIQQSSNLTYRIYDYDRTDSQGKKRPLHVQQALEVIDFAGGGQEKPALAQEQNAPGCRKTQLVAKKYFVVELYELTQKLSEQAQDRFFIYTFLCGEGVVRYPGGELSIRAAESLFIPAALGEYTIEGNLKFLKSYLPD
jgi:mannose-6-phosphate isomerase